MIVARLPALDNLGHDGGHLIHANERMRWIVCIHPEADNTYQPVFRHLPGKCGLIHASLSMHEQNG